MSKVFSVASWNVEHFGKGQQSKADSDRVKDVVEFIAGNKTNDGGPTTIPDVFVIFEVEGRDIYRYFMEKFTDHRFHLTEGKQTQEIFVGVHRNLQTFSTQRMEFKTGRQYQRPGLLLTIHKDNNHYPLLFLHIKSGQGTEDFGLRDAALIHAFNLKKALGESSNFIFLGDLNTMGIDDPVPYSKELDYESDEEIIRLKDWAGKRNMKLIDKNSDFTWYNGSDNYEPTNLDHVIASDHLDIRSADNKLATVSVLGWPRLPTERWDDWFKLYSDHAMIYFEIWQ
jgi:hypothetical protein